MGANLTKMPEWVLEHRAITAEDLHQARLRRSAIEFGAFNRTAFGKQLEARYDKYSPPAMAREARAADEGNPVLAELFTEKRPQLGAAVNLDLGAVAIPEGLVIASSSKVYFYVVMNSIAPQWMPHEVRHTSHADLCASLGPDVDACRRLIDPVLSAEDCVHTRTIQTEFAKEIASFRAQYEDAFNPAYFRELYADVCTPDSPL
ncbi:MAG: hypothetical protein WBO43_12995, partial [Gemmatimonadota bacterium]